MIRRSMCGSTATTSPRLASRRVSCASTRRARSRRTWSATRAGSTPRSTGRGRRRATPPTTRSGRPVSSRPSSPSCGARRSSRRCASTTEGSRSANPSSARPSPATTCSSRSTSTPRRSPRTRSQQGMEGARRLVSPEGGYYQATGGAVVVLDARTGAVVALASAPTFDPNVIVTGGLPPEYLDPNGSLPLIDRALSAYAPGSTFKLFSGMATLKYGIRAADDTYYDDGCVTFGNEEKRCNARKTKYGYVNLPARAHRLERRVLLQRGQAVLERLHGRRGRRQFAQPPASATGSRRSRGPSASVRRPGSVSAGTSRAGSRISRSTRRSTRTATTRRRRPGARATARASPSARATCSSHRCSSPTATPRSPTAARSTARSWSRASTPAPPDNPRVRSGSCSRLVDARRPARHRPHPRGPRPGARGHRRRGERPVGHRVLLVQHLRRRARRRQDRHRAGGEEAGHVVVRGHHEPGERPGAAAVRRGRDGRAGRVRRRRGRADRAPGDGLPQRQPRSRAGALRRPRRSRRATDVDDPPRDRRHAAEPRRLASTSLQCATSTSCSSAQCSRSAASVS